MTLIKDLHVNPYIFGPPIKDKRNFFGRQNILKFLLAELSSPDQNVVVLYGQRRIGKTSVLQQLRQRLPAEDFAVVFHDLMGEARKSLTDLLFSLACEIAIALDLGRPALNSFKADCRTAFKEQFLPLAFKALKPNQRLVILLDEFDALDTNYLDFLQQEDIAEKAFFPYLMELIQNETRFVFVCVIGRRLEDLNNLTLGVFKGAKSERIGLLSKNEAVDLVCTGERLNQLKIQEEAINRILKLTSGHPCFLQLVCNILFTEAYDVEPETMPVVTASMVDAVIPQILTVGESVFEWFWDGLPAAERLILAGLAEILKTEDNLASEEQVLNIFHKEKIRILQEDLKLAPFHLVEWEILDVNSKDYKFRVELIRRWVATKKVLPAIRHEVDRLNPRANQYFRLGRFEYESGNLPEAITAFKNTLLVNPHHLGARLALGASFREINELDQAIQEYDEAYVLDPDAARSELASTLFLRGNTNVRKNEFDLALLDFERALKIVPDYEEVNRYKQGVYYDLGQKGLAANKFQEANDYFKNAGIEDSYHHFKLQYRMFTELQQEISAIDNRRTNLSKRINHTINSLVELRQYKILAEFIEDVLPVVQDKSKILWVPERKHGFISQAVRGGFSGLAEFFEVAIPFIRKKDNILGIKTRNEHWLVYRTAWRFFLGFTIIAIVFLILGGIASFINEQYFRPYEFLVSQLNFSLFWLFVGMIVEMMWAWIFFKGLYRLDNRQWLRVIISKPLFFGIGVCIAFSSVLIFMMMGIRFLKVLQKQVSEALASIDWADCLGFTTLFVFIVLCLIILKQKSKSE